MGEPRRVVQGMPGPAPRLMVPFYCPDCGTRATLYDAYQGPPICKAAHETGGDRYMKVFRLPRYPRGDETLNLVYVQEEM